MNDTATLLDDPRLLHLRCGDMRVGIAPQCGGSVAYFAEMTPMGPSDWFRPATLVALDARDGERMACFPLVPVSGRIAGARLDWDGRSIALPHNVAGEPNHLHGEGWQLPWSVAEHDDIAARLVLDHGTPDWPFAYSAEINYRLDRSALHITMRLRNAGAVDMPAALGIHPWFPAPAAELTADVGTLWAIGADKLFTGKEQPASHRDPRHGVSLALADLEHGFSDWNGQARLRWPERDRVLDIDASPELGHLVVYTRHPSGAFCVEPVSCSVDAFNLAARGVAGTGTRRLAPGDVMAARVSFTLTTTAPRPA